MSGSGTLLATGTGLTELFSHAFMVDALLAGVPIAALAGLVGYFMVLRSQIFTGDALSHAAFTGALGALAFGIDARLGLFTVTLAVAAGLGLLGNHGRADDVVIGTVFAWVLGLGVLALSVYASSYHATSNGAAGVTVLFGSIFGISSTQATLAAAIAFVLIGLMLGIARPLLFASLDQAIAAARGVPVRGLGVVFLLIVGATAAEATQAVGALLLLGLLAAPAGAAQRLTTRPYVGMTLAAALSMLAMVTGLLTSYLIPKVPPSFAILAVATLIYAATFLRRINYPSTGTNTAPSEQVDRPDRSHSGVPG
ncbi:MAG TPA: metal ABC transporter permease [Actinomycetes bacterium]|nr:metal ABC transporter permease [Actinomycetes bacterium]